MLKWTQINSKLPLVTNETETETAPPEPSATLMSTPSIQTAPFQIPRKAPVAPVVREPVETPWRFKACLAIASNGKLVGVIECTPMPTPRKAPVVHEPVETPWHSTARLPIALNGKLVDVIECTPTRLRPQRQPTQNVAIQEKGKFPIFLFPLIAFQIYLLEVSKWTHY